MKLRFTNEKAVEAWFDRVPKCGPTDPSLDVYGSNLMAKGHTLFSYGTHFALAMWYPKEQVFLTNTSTRRSASTNKHQSYVRRNGVIPRRIEVGCMIDHDPRMSADKFLQRWDNWIRHDLDKSKRAHKHYAWWLGRVGEHIRNRNSFIDTFKIPALPLPEDVTAALVTLKLAA